MYYANFSRLKFHVKHLKVIKQEENTDSTNETKYHSKCF